MDNIAWPTMATGIGTTSATVTYPQPAVCPDCGRCRTCGQPQPPITVQPIWCVPLRPWEGPTWTATTSISLANADALAGEVR